MATVRKHTFFYRNGLSLVLLALLLATFCGQFVAGWYDKNQERTDEHQPPLRLSEYAHSGHFIQATFENWESEFLQMGVYVLLTIWLRQQGSSESKKLDEEEEVDREPKPGPDAPWPVRKGGFWLRLYSGSLSLAFVLLFSLSFVAHLYGSLKNFNEEQIEKALPLTTWGEHIASSRFWFESFQNWQSEFLAVFSIVVLSIWLRQKGSPESKPVDAPHCETEE